MPAKKRRPWTRRGAARTAPAAAALPGRLGEGLTGSKRTWPAQEEPGWSTRQLQPTKQWLRAITFHDPRARPGSGRNCYDVGCDPPPQPPRSGRGYSLPKVSDEATAGVRGPWPASARLRAATELSWRVPWRPFGAMAAQAVAPPLRSQSGDEAAAAARGRLAPRTVGYSAANLSPVSRPRCPRG